MKNEEQEKPSNKAMYRRWVYMAFAIVVAALLPLKSMLSFYDDKGIIYVRSYSMDQKEFIVTQTEMSTGVPEVTERMSVVGLHYCYKAMLWGAIICLLCFHNPWRRWICSANILFGAAYLVLLVIYVLRIEEQHFATLSPSFAVLLPILYLQMMVFTLRNIYTSRIEELG